MGFAGSSVGYGDGLPGAAAAVPGGDVGISTGLGRWCRRVRG